MRRTRFFPALLVAHLLVYVPVFGQNNRTATLVTRMAKVGRAGSPTFSPDGKRLAFVSDLNGVPQIWTMPTDAGFPALITNDNDPVGNVTWSPTSDWLWRKTNNRVTSTEDGRVLQQVPEPD